MVGVVTPDRCARLAWLGTRTGDMLERTGWLASGRASVEADYDATASAFDADPYPNDGQEEWVGRLLTECPQGGLVLDAPCGTGRYFEQIANSGRRVVGIDLSAGMLERARSRGIAEGLHHLGLHEFSLSERFDAAITVDAMEHVSPEDWPVVLANIHAALAPGAYWYISVEEADRARLVESFESLTAAGQPAVLGEVTSPATGGYHFYPEREQVVAWFAGEGLEVVDEALTP